MKAHWKITWNNGKIEFLCKQCFVSIPKYNADDISTCKEDRPCDKCATKRPEALQQ